jgi:hypothetical protein
VITQKMAPPGWHGKLQFRLAMRFEQYGEPDPIFAACTRRRA